MEKIFVLLSQAAVSYAVGVLFRLVLCLNGCGKTDLLDIVIYKLCTRVFLTESAFQCSCLYLQLLYGYADGVSREAVPNIFLKKKSKK